MVVQARGGPRRAEAVSRGEGGVQVVARGRGRGVLLGWYFKKTSIFLFFFRPAKTEKEKKITSFFLFFYLLFPPRTKKKKNSLKKGPARVYTLASYQGLDRVKLGDYFWRFTYLPPPLAEFRPEKVPIYCRCSLPYNPDTFMIMCSRCEDWFHPRCVGLSKDGVSAAIASREYACPQCAAAAKGNGGGG